MAIFTGNWSDPEGKPLFPGTIGRRGSGASHQAQVAVHNVANPILHHSWHSIIPLIRDRWYNVLTDQLRERWLTWSDPAYPARDYDVSIAGKGFTAFASLNWPVAWGLSGRWRDNPLDPQLHVMPPTFDEANAATQSVTVLVDYLEWPQVGDPGATYFFQVDPARFNSTRHLRFTRALGALWQWDAHGPDYVFQAPATFPFQAGDTVRIAYRHCQGSIFDATEYLDLEAA